MHFSSIDSDGPFVVHACEPRGEPTNSEGDRGPQSGTKRRLCRNKISTVWNLSFCTRDGSHLVHPPASIPSFCRTENATYFSSGPGVPGQRIRERGREGRVRAASANTAKLDRLRSTYQWANGLAAVMQYPWTVPCSENRATCCQCAGQSQSLLPVRVSYKSAPDSRALRDDFWAGFNALQNLRDPRSGQIITEEGHNSTVAKCLGINLRRFCPPLNPSPIPLHRADAKQLIVWLFIRLVRLMRSTEEQFTGWRWQNPRQKQTTMNRQNKFRYPA